MQKMKEILAKLVKNQANKMIDKDTRAWPPECWFFAYQAERPTENANSETK